MQRLKINDPVIITIAVECGNPGKPTNGKQIVRKGYVYGGPACLFVTRITL